MYSTIKIIEKRMGEEMRINFVNGGIAQCVSVRMRTRGLQAPRWKVRHYYRVKTGQPSETVCFPKG